MGLTSNSANVLILSFMITTSITCWWASLWGGCAVAMKHGNGEQKLETEFL